MGVVTTVLRGQLFTPADLDTMPDDGHRYELVDGAIVVTPSPTPRHQHVALRVACLLDRALTPGLRMFMAPLEVVLCDDSVLQPDVLVAPATDVTDTNVSAPPLLAIEVLSPGTRLVDLNLKRERYESAGCASCWIIDPDRPSLTAWELQDGRYVEVADVSAAEPFVATRPFAVTIVPDELTQE